MSSTVERAPQGFVGREPERREVLDAVAACQEGRGGFLLIAGEAGVGKTRLVEEILRESDVLTLSAAPAQAGEPPYGPLVAVLRSYLRAVPDGLAECGPLLSYLAVLLPELGVPAKETDRRTLFAAIRSALTAVAARGPTSVFLDDLQWADSTTLELLPAIAASTDQEPLLLLGAYRSDELRRGHPVRRLRGELRRAGRLRELVIQPLEADQTAVLVEQVLGQAPSVRLASAIYLRTQGIPFFVEELARALSAAGRLERGDAGFELLGANELPIPDTVRDTILLRADTLSSSARAILEVAAVAGLRFDLGVVSELASDEGLEEAMESGFLEAEERGGAAFRHALTREALYNALGWQRRRSLHHEIAARLEKADAGSGILAEHWLGAGEHERARKALLEVAETSCALHAHRDALDAWQRALELWPQGGERERLQALEGLGNCAQLSGDFPEALRAWREAADGWAALDDRSAEANVQRQLAGVYEVQCSWDLAFAARHAAAEGFGASGQPGEAAAEQLAAAANLQSTGSLTAALELIRLARQGGEESGRRDLQARALGLEGLVLARLGDVEAGLESARAGLSLALAENLTAAAAETYERLGMILENSSDYRRAIDAWTTAFDFCQAHSASAKAHLCLGCLAYVFRKTGEWSRAVEVCDEVLSAEDAPRAARCAAVGQLGLIDVLQGRVKKGRPKVAEAFALAQRTEFAIMKIDGLWGLACADEAEGEHDSAVERCRSLLELAENGEDSHYPVGPLRWATGLFASRQAPREAAACAEVLARLASLTANTEALAALAHALGEIALLEGDPEHAATQFGRALELLRDVELPFDRAETQLRAGVALAAAGEREPAIGRLTESYRTARKLGARPLAARVAEQLARIGEPVDRRVRVQAAGEVERSGLTRRELEVLRFVAAGRTNREIAHDLFLSARTVDMHVRNILRKLDCRSRTQAVSKAGDLALLG